MPAAARRAWPRACQISCRVPPAAALPRVASSSAKISTTRSISVLRRRHRLDDIAGVFRMIVAVIADEFAFVFVRREESCLAFSAFDDVQFSVAVSLDLERLKELPPLVHLECARLFLFVNDVRRRSGGDANGACRKLVHFARLFKFAGLGDRNSDARRSGP